MAHNTLNNTRELMGRVVEAFGIEIDFVLRAIVLGEERYEVEHLLFVARRVGVEIAIFFAIENIAQFEVETNEGVVHQFVVVDVVGAIDG